MRLQRFLILGLFLLIPWRAAMAGDGCSRAFTVGWTDIPPAFYPGPDGKPVGIDIDILKAVLDSADCRYETRHMPFKRYVEALKFGLVDIVMSASKSAERERFAHFSHPYRREQMVLFSTPETLRHLAVDTLAGFAGADATVAAGLGMWLGPDFTALYDGNPAFKARTLMIDGYPAMLRAVAAGRVDTLVGDANGVWYLIQELKLGGQIVATPIVVHDNDVHFMFSKKAVPESDVARIDAALVQFVGSPVYLDILTRYPAAEPASLIPRAFADK